MTELHGGASAAPPDSRRAVRGYVLIAGAAVLWATLGPAARFVFDAGVAPIELSFWRAAFAGALFALHASGRGRLRIERRDVPAVGGFALLGVSLLYWAYFRAVQEGGAALAAILLYTAPAWVAVGASIWLHERLTLRKVAALAGTLAGIVLIARASTPSTDHALPGGFGGIGWGLLAGLSYALYYLYGKRFFARYGTETLFAYALPIGALALLPAVRFAAKAPTTWALLLFVSVVPTYAAYLLYAEGLRRVEATRAATVATLEPLVATLLAFLMWGEVLGGAGYAGAALILAGVLLVSTAK